MDFWDPDRPNVVLLADHTDTLWMMKCNGIERLASELRQAGYQVAIINHLHTFGYEELKYLLSHIINRNTLFVGISNFFYKDISNTSRGPDGELYYGWPEPGQFLPHGSHLNQDFRDFIHMQNPRCPVVMGGPATFDGAWNSLADYLVIGYADRSIVNLANHLHKGESLKFNHRSEHGPMVIRDYRADGLEFDSVKSIKRSYDCYLKGETLPIEIARGCIFKCKFCSYPFIGKKKFDYVRQEDILLEEMSENYERYGITRYMFSDDTFNDTVQKIDSIGNIVRQLPKPIQFWSYLRQDLLVLPGMVEGLYNIGLRAGQFGIETLNKQAGKQINKMSDRDRVMNNIELLVDYPRKQGHSLGRNYFNTHANLLVGLPGDSKADIMDGLTWLQNHKNIPASTMNYIAFRIENAKYNAFPSEIAKDPAKFGYTITGETPFVRSWKNEYMTSDESNDLTEYCNNQLANLPWYKVSGYYAFYGAGLGLDFDKLWSLKFADFPWHDCFNAKEIRKREYKTLLSQSFNIPMDVDWNFTKAQKVSIQAGHSEGRNTMHNFQYQKESSPENSFDKKKTRQPNK